MLGDTIVALASAPGASERAVLRLSGPAARTAAQRVFDPALPAERAQVDGQVHVPRVRLPAYALVMPGPRSFTGEDVVELHVPGSPMLVQLLLDELLRDGAADGVRAALPGEFTARAFRHGKLDAMQVEGLLLLLHAGDRRAAAAAVPWLTGGLGEVVRALRLDLLDTLALLEFGLDFEEGAGLGVDAFAPRLRPLAARCAELAASLPIVPAGGEVLLLGCSGAGKSSLANALAGAERAIVGDGGDRAGGTTRDLLRIEIAPGVHLWDAPGDLDAPADVDRQALALRDRLAGTAGAAALVLDATAPRVPPAIATVPLPWFGVIWTKCDDPAVAAPVLPAAAGFCSAAPVFATSARTGRGLAALRAALSTARGGAPVDAGGPLRTALATAAAAIERAAAAASLGPELAAVELRQALDALDVLLARDATELVLDRIHTRFCLGK